MGGGPRRARRSGERDGTVTRSWIDLLGAFDRECSALLDVLSDLPEPEFARVTNCPPWTLHELVVHICFSACTFPAEMPAPAAGAVLITAADYYRRPERASETYRTANVDNTQRVARRFATGHDATEAVASVWATTRSRLEQLEPDTTMAGRSNVSRGGTVLAETTMHLADFFVTRVIALAAHAADVAISLDREPWTTPEALEVVTPPLADLLGRDPTAELGWDRLQFLLTATGRRPLTAEEREQLAQQSDQFPLLS